MMVILIRNVYTVTEEIIL